MRTRNIVFSIFMLLLCGVIFAELQSPKYDATIFFGEGFDPVMFPQIVLWGVVSLAGILLIKALFLSADRSSDRGPDFSLLRAAGYILLVLGYIVLMNYLGFLIATVFFLIVCMYAAQYRRITILVPVAAVFTFAAWWIFTGPLSVALP